MVGTDEKPIELDAIIHECERTTKLASALGNKATELSAKKVVKLLLDLQAD